MVRLLVRIAPPLRAVLVGMLREADQTRRREKPWLQARLAEADATGANYETSGMIQVPSISK